MLSTDAAVELRGHGDSVLCLDSDPSRLASASSDGSVRLWDLNSCRVARALMLPELAEAQSVVLGCGSGPAANCVFTAADRTIYAYDLRAPAVVLRQPTQLIGAAHEEGDRQRRQRETAQPRHHEERLQQQALRKVGGPRPRLAARALDHGGRVHGGARKRRSIDAGGRAIVGGGRHGVPLDGKRGLTIPFRTVS